jgi:MinD-like ATPase involved in chromosome partitioning or flagellar assembly
MLIDLVGGADASQALGVDIRTGLFSVSAVLTGQASLKSVRVPTASGIDLVAGHAEVMQYLGGASQALTVMREQFHIFGSDYHYIVLDCPARLGPIETAALTLAQHVVITYCPGQVAGRTLPALPRLQYAYITGSVGIVANKVLPDWTATHHGNQSDWDIPVRSLGGVRYESGLPEMYWRGLPPVITRPVTDFAQDILSIAQCVQAN